MAIQGAGGVRGVEEPDPEVRERARMRTFSPSYKLRTLDEYDRLDKVGKGALLRRAGRYSSLIREGRKQRDHGAIAARAQKRGRPEIDVRDREVSRLRQENQRLAGELHKARRVIEVQGNRSAGVLRF